MNERDRPQLQLPLGQYLNSDLSPALEDAVWAKVDTRRGEALGVKTDVELPVPLSEVLMDGEDMAPERARLWRSVRARVHRPRSKRMPRRFAMAFAAALGAAVAGVVFALALHGSQVGSSRASVARPGALLASNGRPLSAVEAETEAHTVRLSDRSEIRLAHGARIEPVLSTSTRFELLLARGTAEFSVTPGGPRRWSIDAGPARVEVVGTVFTVQRLPEGVNVSVSRGVVLVFGESIPGRVRRLLAGQTVSVPAQSAATKDPTSAADGNRLSDETRDVVVASQPKSTLPRAADQTIAPPGPAIEPVTRGKRRASSATAAPPSEDPHKRYAELGPAGLARETMKAASIERLLELADVARLSGHPQDAVAPLTRALDAFRGDRQAALAAFTLGRVLLDQLGVAQPAAEAFERAIDLGLPKALRADCYRRLAEAYGSAGNEAERIRAEARFQTEFALPSSVLDKVAP